MATKRREIVEVEWVDSCTYTAWSSKRNHEENAPDPCRTAGYLLKKDRKQVSVSQSLSDKLDSVTDTIAIPIASVVSVRHVGWSQPKRRR